MLKRVLLAAVLIVPVAAWAFIKPLRVLAPQLAGVFCATDTLCIDDSSRFEEARQLYEESLAFVGATVGEIEKRPRVIFCATEACFRSFGAGRSTADTIGTIGIVISPRGWKPHYIRHEMIHHLQQERLGTLKIWLITPSWFSEGMAYSFSKDPRSNLAEPFKQYRFQFDEWYKKVGKDRLWEEASRL
jgi:hypothetical protein